MTTFPSSECCCDTKAALTTENFDVVECAYRPSAQLPRYERDRAAFCLVVDGGYEERSGASTVHHRSATLVFHPAGTTHTSVISPRGSQCLTIGIAPVVLAAVSNVAPNLPGLAARLTTSRHGAAHWLAYKLRAELYAADALTALIVDGLGLALVGEFLRTPAARVGKNAPTWLERARQHVHEEFAHPPSLGALADAAGVHRAHLARAFRLHYACTVGEYVRQRRIEHACHRLASTDAPLSDVALDAGFADQSHFTTSFRRLVGVTPREFRSRVVGGR